MICNNNYKEKKEIHNYNFIDRKMIIKWFYWYKTIKWDNKIILLIYDKKMIYLFAKDDDILMIDSIGNNGA